MFKKILFMSVVLCFLCGAAMAYSPLAYTNQVIESVAGRSYTGVAVGAADATKTGNQVYAVSNTASTGYSDLAQFSLAGSVWSGIGLEHNTEYHYGVAIGDARPDLAGKEVYVAKSGAVSFFHMTTAWTGYDVERTGSREYRTIAVGDADTSVAGSEVYFAGTAGLAEYYWNGSGMTGVGIDGSANFQDLAIGEINGAFAGNELLYGQSNTGGGLGYFTNRAWASEFQNGGGIRSYGAVAVGNADPTKPGNETYTLWNATGGGFGQDYWVAGTPNQGFPIGSGNDARLWDSVVAGDLDGDGIDEIVAAASATGTNNGILSIFYNNGTGWSEQALSYGNKFYNVALGDVNRDGYLDIVYGGEGEAGVYLNTIPEPATMGLLSLGSIVLLRRKK